MDQPRDVGYPGKGVILGEATLSAAEAIPEVADSCCSATSTPSSRMTGPS